MTEDMNDIARKTKIETVSMKVITLVTLFFLPGTFISVRHIFPSVSPRSVAQTMTSSPLFLHHPSSRTRGPPSKKLTAKLSFFLSRRS